MVVAFRVLDDETRTFQTFLVVHLGTCQVLETHRIDNQTHTFALDDGVVIGHFFIEGEAVLKT